MSKRVQVLGVYYLTENWVSKHPGIRVSVVHHGCPYDEKRPLSISISPSGGWGSRGVRWFERDDSWEEAVNHCVELIHLGILLSAIKMHGSTIYTTEQLHQAINVMIANEQFSEEASV